jgi:hypothetical protein
MKNLESLRSLFQSYYGHLVQRVFECLEGGATMKIGRVISKDGNFFSHFPRRVDYDG